MPSYYFDTSAALKHYHVEQGTQDVRRLVHDPAAACILSRLTLTEMQRAFARRARQREITGDGLKQLRGVLYKDLHLRDKDEGFNFPSSLLINLKVEALATREATILT